MGEVGGHIARVLTDDGHDVVLIDRSAAALQRAEELLDVSTIVGHGGDLERLRQANVATCDLFVAVTDHCELNLVACVQARALGAKRTVARVMGAAYGELSRERATNPFGIDLIINPTIQIAAEIRRLVRSGTAIAVQDFADRLIEMMQLPVDAGARSIGVPLKDLRVPEQTLVAAILRGDELVVPGGNDAVLAGDEVLVIGRTEHIAEVERAFGRKRSRFGRRAILVGGGELAVHVANALADDGFHVVIMERDRARCQELARELDRAVVLHADGTNSALLEEEGVSSADVFVAISDEDELNLMASVLAKDLGAPRCIALVHRPDYAHICERLGIDATLSPRLTVAQHVLKYVREGDVVSVTPVLDGRAEFVELVVSDKSRIAGMTLQDAGFPRGSIACAVLRPAGAFVPRGDTVLAAGDQVVVFLRTEARGGVERLFRKPAFGRSS